MSQRFKYTAFFGETPLASFPSKSDACDHLHRFVDKRERDCRSFRDRDSEDGRDYWDDMIAHLIDVRHRMTSAFTRKAMRRHDLFDYGGFSIRRFLVN